MNYNKNPLAEATASKSNLIYKVNQVEDRIQAEKTNLNVKKTYFYVFNFIVMKNINIVTI